jgi:hypothetical protein
VARNDIDVDSCEKSGSELEVQNRRWTRRHTPMCDGKRVDMSDSRGVATVPACRVVTGVSSLGKWGVARGGG